MQEPVLFNYATKELSQDAFFCWLFSWSGENFKHTKLNIIANDFLRDITNEKITINKIEIVQQYKKIDFYLRINENTTIVFEDKVKTSEHSNQLKRYREIILNEYPNDKLYFVYLKTDIIFSNEYNCVEESKYKVYDLFVIYNKLPRKTNNAIYNDFMNYLSQKVKSYQEFEKIRFSKWGQNEWIGLCFRLQNEIKQSAFYGIWQGRELYWGIMESDFLLKKNIWASLEIKHSLGNNDGRLCILLHIEDKRLNKYAIKDELKTKLEKLFKEESFEISNRIGGQTNFIRFYNFPVIKNGYIDFNKTKENLDMIILKFKKV